MENTTANMVIKGLNFVTWFNGLDGLMYLEELVELELG